MASRTITNVAEELIPRNSYRKSLTIQNQDAAINIFIKKEAAGSTTVSTTDHDIRLGPGVQISLTTLNDGDETVIERWTIIAASGTPRVSIFEGENIKR